MIGQRIKIGLHSLTEWLNLHFAYASTPLKEFGFIMALTTPLFYCLWSYFYVEPFESLGLRAGVVLLGLIMGSGVIEMAPMHRVRSWFLLISIAIMLPFFYTYYFLMNEGTLISILSLLSSLFLLVLLVDTALFFLILTLGVLGAFLLYYFSVPVMYFGEEHIDRSLVFIFILMAGLFVRYKQHLFIQMRLQGMAAAAGMIAHELRTPLLSIRSGAKGLEQLLPVLIESYHQAVAHGWVKPITRTTRILQLNTLVARLVREVDYSNVMIDMLLFNAKTHKLKSAEEAETTSMQKTIEAALARYPFKSEDEKQLIYTDGDFLYKGTPVLMEHVLFNLLKNALTQIHMHQKGGIFIEARQDAQKNYLVFKDTARGMSADEVSQIFTHFYSNTLTGTGLGLSFCREALYQMGAEIMCLAKQGEYTEFKMVFPRVDNPI